MEKIGKSVKQVLKDVNQRVTSIKDSTPSGYKCSECGKELTWKEFQISREWQIWSSKMACQQHLETVREKERKKLLGNIKSKIVAVVHQRNVPLRYLHCSFDNFEAVDSKRRKYLKIGKEYAELNLLGMGKGLFLSGPNGTGKTHLAVAIMRELSLKGHLNWYFVKSPYLLMEIRKAFKVESFDSEENLIKRFVDYDYLVIDELGVETTTGWTAQTLYLIIDGRSDNLKSTIITSNLSLQDIEDKIDPRLASRIVGMSKELLEFTCDDYRLRKRG